MHDRYILNGRPSTSTGTRDILERLHTGLMRRKGTHKHSHLMTVLTNSAIPVRGMISSSTSLLPSREPVIATSAWCFERNARSPADGNLDASMAWTMVWHLFPASIIRHADFTLDPTFAQKFSLGTVESMRDVSTVLHIHTSSL